MYPKLRIPWGTNSHQRILIFLIIIITFTCIQNGNTKPGQFPTGRLIQRSIPPADAKTHQVVLGERFTAEKFKKWLYGRDYRQLWTTPITVDVLDLDTVGGGLTPLRTGGFGQSISLHFTGTDGRRYTVRSIDKDPTKRIWDELKGTIVENVLQDQISALLPAGALICDPLMQATGILHSRHTLVVIPDDPRLGKYRQEFAGLIGTLQEHPSEGPNDTPGFAGSDKISGTEKLWQHLGKTPRNRVDAHAYLKARLMDFLINDKDRHAGQWRWARFPDGDNYKWVPIPEDRDQAFIDLDGFAMAIARRASPRQIKFENSYPNVVGLSFTGWELDREFLAELQKDDWEKIIKEFQHQLPDSVIETAVQALPQPYYALVGESVTKALKSRRDKLPEFAIRYYHLITREPEILATDKKEIAELEHLPNGDLSVHLSLWTKGKNTAKTADNAPYFQRIFHASETSELRLYLRGGHDQTIITGAKAKIKVRIAGGGGDDTYINSSLAGSDKVKFYDFRGKNQFETGNGATIDRHPYQRPAGPELNNMRYSLDWGQEPFSLPYLEATRDLGLYVGMISGRVYYGYRRSPYAARHEFSYGVAMNDGKFQPFVGYQGKFRHVWHNIDATVRTDYSGIHVLRYNGLGNATELSGSSSFYKVEQKTFVLAPSFEFNAGINRGTGHSTSAGVLRETLTINLGPVLKFSDTPLSRNKDKFINTFVPSLYGSGKFGQIGFIGKINLDTRDNHSYPKNGYLLQLNGAVYPELWDVQSTFGTISGNITTYLSAKIMMNPTLAVRVGGEKVWGTVPFHESAFLGGHKTLRGFRRSRFGGQASVYSNTELRFRLAHIRIIVPAEFGMFAASDAGQVFWNGDAAGTNDWHTSFGGGLWLCIPKFERTVSITVMRGANITGYYAQFGFQF